MVRSVGALLRSWLDAFDAHAMQSALWGDADNEVCAARSCKEMQQFVAAVTKDQRTVVSSQTGWPGVDAMSSADRRGLARIHTRMHARLLSFKAHLHESPAERWPRERPGARGRQGAHTSFE